MILVVLIKRLNNFIQIWNLNLKIKISTFSFFNKKISKAINNLNKFNRKIITNAIENMLTKNSKNKIVFKVVQIFFTKKNEFGWEV